MNLPPQHRQDRRNHQGQVQNAVAQVQTTIKCGLGIDGRAEKLFKLLLNSLILWTGHVDAPHVVRVAWFLFVSHAPSIPDYLKNCLLDEADLCYDGWQTQNNYDKDVYNGDIGFMRAMDVIEQTLTVDFDGRSATYEWSEADQLTLAYVISVHKAQGSEFPVVVLPIVTQQYMMLQRNLLYTAITRARKLCVLTGSRRAIGMAVRNNKVAQRFTGLEWRLIR
jgi:hypothetical protein